MQRQCPDCKGWKGGGTMASFGFAPPTALKCALCNGTGYITGKRPAKHQHGRKKTKRLGASAEIKERRKAAKAAKKNDKAAMKRYLSGIHTH